MIIVDTVFLIINNTRLYSVLKTQISKLGRRTRFWQNIHQYQSCLVEYLSLLTIKHCETVTMVYMYHCGYEMKQFLIFRYISVICAHIQTLSFQVLYFTCPVNDLNVPRVSFYFFLIRKLVLHYENICCFYVVVYLFVLS